MTVLRYVERNPLRANLVETADAWRWSSLCIESTATRRASWTTDRWRAAVLATTCADTTDRSDLEALRVP